MKNPSELLLSKHDWSVRLIDPHSFKAARSYVQTLHYTGSTANTAVYVHGLFWVGAGAPPAADELVGSVLPERGESGGCFGLAWWMPPIKPAAVYVGKKCGVEWRRVLNLSRLVVHPSVGRNGASFLLGRSERLIRSAGEWQALVTYADLSEGHSGGIYKATNWVYDGLTRSTPIWVDAEGHRVSPKATVNLTKAEMLRRGHRIAGKSEKHRFYKCL